MYEIRPLPWSETVTPVHSYIDGITVTSNSVTQTATIPGLCHYFFHYYPDRKEKITVFFVGIDGMVSIATVRTAKKAMQAAETHWIGFIEKALTKL